LIPFPLVTASDDIRGLKPFLATEPNWPLIVFFALLGLVALGTAFALLLRRPKRRPPVRPPSGPAPQHPQAIRERLDALRASGLIEAGEATLFCDQLSEILRDFLRQRFGLSSRRLTTSEIMQSLRSRAPDSVCRPLEEVLSDCDLVKFAKVRLDAMSLQQTLTTAYLALEAAEIARPRGET
jgi:hypothetical protein